ncbi:MAG: amino acid adenylation domain-containing protein [Nostoc sp. DedQUE08]|uniref:amino acid adenylation domain-containing protein n=1 Tax=Nostoc sp. DedQUE08 TaxID=3075393 RepID=UPI002AD4A137|nr:amino acid adenylation domain-containing protein [Nostoc sp. DedQUE08]MDZ8068511.1 amino acid adenylation domain-containing protein [Nostoc sp. DedQUE08]
MSDSTKNTANLPPDEKRALLAKKLREKAETEQTQSTKTATKLPRIVPNPKERYKPFPLTDIQQAYWIGRMGAFQGGNVAIHAYMEIENTSLDLVSLNIAWQQLIERHDMLRSIVLTDGQQQILAQVPPYEIKIFDLRNQDPAVVEDHLLVTRQRLSHQVLPSEKWPLFEICASRLDDSLIRLHISIDALNIDIGSFMILIREWVQVYQNPDISLTPLELSYRDYVLALEALRDSDLYQKSLNYWRSRLVSLPPAPDLPFIQLSQNTESSQFCRFSYQLNKEAWQRLKAHASQAGLTPSGILLAAYSEVLTIWSRIDHFTLNVTLFNRLPVHPQINDILGDFTSIILLEIDNSVTDNFITRAQKIQRQLWNDLEHRFVSGIQVLRELTHHLGKTGEAIMPIVFTSALDSIGSSQGLNSLAQLGEKVYSISQTPQVWLDHQVFEEDGTLLFNWDAFEAIFPEGLLQDMFDAYCQLLQNLANKPTIWTEANNCLIPSAQLQQIALLNGVEADIPEELLHSLFSRRANQQPNYPAIITTNLTLSYEEVDCYSNQVGSQLRNWGARPNTLVAIVMDKGWEQIVAVLSILKSGAAYLPIDPNIPNDRLLLLLDNGEVNIVLTQSSIDNKIPWPAHIHKIYIDQQPLDDIKHPPLKPIQKPEDLAYVIYTSGSTGLPKGVMIEHRNVVNRITDINQRFGINPGDRALALTSLHHDLSVYDIFGILTAGGTLVLPDAGLTRDPSHWVKLIYQEKVTFWNSVPAFMQMLVEHLENIPNFQDHLLRSLRLVILSGDWIPVTLPDRLRSLINSVQVISAGGPTETTVWDICYPIVTVDPNWKSIPYGCPLTNARYYILNEKLMPCPVWVAGQLYIGGAGLARGYWRDSEETNKKFINHPKTGERLYNSGDLGKLLPDGNIEFLGREDFQIKLRGYRVELGEIEKVLCQHPEVESVVVTITGSPGNESLISYIVPKDKQLISNELQIQIKQKLPENFNQQQEKNIILDPLKRLEFKIKQPGLRQDLNKSYVNLSKPELTEELKLKYIQRRSYREFLSSLISLHQFSEFLSCLYNIEIDALPKYQYASAGGLYPVQTYLYIKPNQIEGIKAGIYYYHPKEHCLLIISECILTSEDIHSSINRDAFEESAFSVFFIGRMNAITPMYGDLSKEFCLLEAGYISQLLMTTASSHKIGLCPIGGINFEKICDLFLLEENDIFLHSLVGGLINFQPKVKQPFNTQLSLKPSPQVFKKNDFLDIDLKKLLRQKLPDYMVPSHLIFIDSLPLNPNGKVDRKSLPLPNYFNINLDKIENVAQPNTQIMENLKGIFQEVLELKNIGIHDNFFDLGANSIHIVKAHNKLQNIFNKNIPIIELFQYSTLNSLAQYLSQKIEEKQILQEADQRAEARRGASKRRKKSI